MTHKDLAGLSLLRFVHSYYAINKIVPSEKMLLFFLDSGLDIIFFPPHSYQKLQESQLLFWTLPQSIKSTNWKHSDCADGPIFVLSNVDTWWGPEPFVPNLYVTFSHSGLTPTSAVLFNEQPSLLTLKRSEFHYSYVQRYKTGLFVSCLGKNVMLYSVWLDRVLNWPQAAQC